MSRRKNLRRSRSVFDYNSDINAVEWYLVVTLGELHQIEMLVLALVRLLRHIQRTGKFEYQLGIFSMA
jgi:hypothetical protein